MTQKYLFALAFAVAVVVASNVAPRGNIDTFGNRNVSVNASHNLIVGRRIPGDRLIIRQNVVTNSSWMQIVTRNQTFSTTRYDTITLVKALDQKTNGTGGFATLIRGGPGYRNVTLGFRSQRSQGINFVVEIYARP